MMFSLASNKHGVIGDQAIFKEKGSVSRSVAKIPERMSNKSISNRNSEQDSRWEFDFSFISLFYDWRESKNISLSPFGYFFWEFCECWFSLVQEQWTVHAAWQADDPSSWKVSKSRKSSSQLDECWNEPVLLPPSNVTFAPLCQWSYSSIFLFYFTDSLEYHLPNGRSFNWKPNLDRQYCQKKFRWVNAHSIGSD